MQKYLKPAAKVAALSVSALAIAVATGTANASETKLRIQTHFSPETLSG
ncbi:MAG: hypothetical protein AB8B84_13760 [Granulosicoccus sp.]